MTFRVSLLLDDSGLVYKFNEWLEVEDGLSVKELVDYAEEEYNGYLVNLQVGSRCKAYSEEGERLWDIVKDGDSWNDFQVDYNKLILDKKYC